MRRKVILHGPSSLGISLPSYWVKKNSIGKGIEIEMNDIENKLQISAIQNIQNCKKTQISFENINYEVQKDILFVLYERGYDEIIIFFNKENTIKNIYKFLNETNLGYEIIEHNKNSFIIRNISIPEDEQFYNLFNRLYKITIEYSQKVFYLSKNIDDITDSGPLHASSISRIAKYSKRIIVKGNIQNSIYYYNLTESLLKISMHLTNLYETILNQNQVENEIIKSIDRISGSLYNTFELFSNFSHRKYYSLKKYLENTKQQIKSYQDSSINCSYIEDIQQINQEVLNLLYPILAINSQG
jgi:hypothetical protein